MTSHMQIEQGFQSWCTMILTNKVMELKNQLDREEQIITQEMENKKPQEVSNMTVDQKANIARLIVRVVDELTKNKAKSTPVPDVLRLLEQDEETSTSDIQQAKYYIVEFWKNYQYDLREQTTEPMRQYSHMLSSIDDVLKKEVTLANPFRLSLFDQYVKQNRNRPIYDLFRQVSIFISQSTRIHPRFMATNTKEKQKIQEYKEKCRLYQWLLPHTICGKMLGITLEQTKAKLQKNSQLYHEQLDITVSIDWLNSVAMAQIEMLLSKIQQGLKIKIGGGTTTTAKNKKELTVVQTGYIDQELTMSYTLITNEFIDLMEYNDKEDYIKELKKIIQQKPSMANHKTEIDGLLKLYTKIIQKNQRATFVEQEKQINTSFIALLDFLLHKRHQRHIYASHHHTILNLTRDTHLEEKQPEEEQEEEEKYDDDGVMDIDTFDSHRQQLESKLIQDDLSVYKTLLSEKIIGFIQNKQDTLWRRMTHDGWKEQVKKEVIIPFDTNECIQGSNLIRFWYDYNLLHSTVLIKTMPHLVIHHNDQLNEYLTEVKVIQNMVKEAITDHEQAYLSHLHQLCDTQLSMKTDDHPHKMPPDWVKVFLMQTWWGNQTKEQMKLLQDAIMPKGTPTNSFDRLVMKYKSIERSAIQDMMSLKEKDLDYDTIHTFIVMVHLIALQTEKEDNDEDIEQPKKKKIRNNSAH